MRTLSRGVARAGGWKARTSHRLLLVTASAAWAATVVVQVATALVADRRPLVNATVALLTVSAWCLTARASRPGTATAALAVGSVLGLAAEWIGTNTGVPFGDYAYTGQLRPSLATVPVAVPLAWFAMGVPAYAAATAIVPPLRGEPLLRTIKRAAVGAVALTAWDLFLDPQMVHEGYWRWAAQGLYQGVPLSNYAGWWSVSFLLMTAFERLIGPDLRENRRIAGLLGLYTSMTVIETVGFLGPLQFDPAVAVAGGLGMGSVCTAAWWSLSRAPEPAPIEVAMAEVVVIGGGVGGMAAALRLRAAGHAVLLCERRPELGGKLAEIIRHGYTFSIGPSMLTWPEVFDDLVAVTGHRLRDLVDLIRVDPIMRYRYRDGSGFDARSSPTDTAAGIEAMAPGHGDRWLHHLEWARGCWQASQGSFFAGPIDRLSDFRRRTGHPRDVLAVDPFRTLAGRASTSFTDPRLRMYAARYATYSGSDPFRAPAALGCTPYLEHTHGVWHVRGGLVRLRDALAGLLEGTGVEVRTDTTVQRLDARRGRVRGVVLAGGEHVAADVVVSDIDAHRLFGSLLPMPRPRRRVQRLGASSSAFLVLAGVRGRSRDLAHHNLFFGRDYRREFRQIFAERRPPTEPSIYLGCSVVDDPTQAPEDAENWTLLVNVPAGDQRTWPVSVADYRDLVLRHLEHYGVEVAGRLSFTETITPNDLEQRYDAWGGAIYSTPHHGRIAPFRRPGNRGPLRGLYLVGGSTHPGGGLPLVAKSAEIVTQLVTEETP